MPKYARIAITLPAPDLAAADRLAAELDRSRSWIIAESVRRYVSEANTIASAIRVGPSRAEQLRRDLALTATERVLDAETVAVARGSASPDSEQPRIFPSYGAFEVWRRTRPAL